VRWNGNVLELGRLALDPQTGQGVSRPLPRGGDPLVFGETSIYAGLPLPGGLPLVGGRCAGPRGELYVMHALGREVLVFDAGGLLRRRLRASYSFGPGAVRVGRGLAVDEGGRVYVVDHKPGGLVCLEPDGTLAWRASENRETGQQLRAPIDCDLLPNGDIVVADSANARLHRVSREGVLLGYLDAGDSEPALGSPFSVAAGPEGRLYVADGGRMALVELDQYGAELRQWPLPLQQRPSLENVPFVAVDAAGNAYVVDTSGWVVYRTVPGQGELAQLPSSTRLSKPWGIAARGDELLVLLGDRRKVVALRP
jgi:streptogramin lyase